MNVQELIDRQAALEIAMSYCPDDDGCCSKAGCDIREMLDEIEALPTAKPEVHRGRWIPIEYDSYADGDPVWDKFECSECGHEHNGEKDTLTAFCPDCGAYMKEERTELLLCPFCGGKAELRQEDFDPHWMPTPNDPDSGGCPPYYVKCNDCGANTEYRYDYPDAIKLWNRRTNNG